MNVTTRKLLINSLSAVMVCLIASTATAIVFAEEPNAEEEPYWGNLKVGDEMRWKYYEPKNLYYELKILEIQGKSLKIYRHEYKVGPHGEIDTIERGTTSLRHGAPGSSYIKPASLINKYKYPATIYSYKGRTYLAGYKGSRGGACSMYTGKCYGPYEFLWDYSTGILFKHKATEIEGGTTILTFHRVLEYTNAKLTTPAMVPGFPLLLLLGVLEGIYLHPVIGIAVIFPFASIIIMVLYRRTRHQKKKTT